jgi:uncharacterized phage-associated protein
MEAVERKTVYPQMTTDDYLKLKAVLLYILDVCGSIDYFHIFKILYFADKKHYATYGKRIVNDTFCALQDGPVPTVLYNAIKIANGKMKRPATASSLTMIADALSVNTDYDYIISAKEKPDMDELAKTDIRFINESIQDNRNIPYGELSLKSHDTAWAEAWNNSNSKILDDLSMARAAGAGDAMIEYIKEQKNIASILSA